MITLTHYLVLAAILFCIALVGILRRKNLLMLFFATEIALNAVNIALAAFSKYYGDLTGQLFAFFIIAIAASEVAVGLGLLIIWYKRRNTLDLDSLQSMHG
ncbi:MULTISPECIES: NADH-quinone oxidoreductase subunit NuoK [Nitratiruptor]|uniref:NADH-quinone oxidoreductase subunit K n=1 Tax=Nitratiruptor tergarcus DSM 16512 TaxID=1069081 RepID=A0A1W1WTC6_9BACT|nr:MULTISPECIES: NADH-quinone oxidoreductase subunit NuoK [Nitratiruptor]BCD61494.1 NADH-quinone oxidoreductase subunit K [Nitratiruptor sp. YY08-13]BCD65428.1 NADH-quinone oxidoreductase subunit K [Nitratiruptor sp. YY08-26]SMC08993.1 NADH dehydrogenase subunit K [Nitratiruptor tergarcus DSM 16512]